MNQAIIMGASSGIGREVARVLIEKGWTVTLAARRQEPLEALRAVAPGRVSVARIDVTDAEAPARLEQLFETMGHVDLYFHASGIGKQNRELEAAIETDTMMTNGVGFVGMVSAAYRCFARQGEGHIACITSVAGTKGLGPAAVYSATKAMQSVYLQALEQLAYGQGLRIGFTDIRPGFVDTPLLTNPRGYPMLLDAAVVARTIVKAVTRRRHVVVIDWRWRLFTALWRRLPRRLWRRLRL
ncbi:SDR family NAD(P)-dependent oxidoreductase [Prevotella sp. A2931]|uniref:SDR family NAD(P)-dependent oxidoreductase n=1 Tax=Prevotella illustrans TaxID=2800387 RepID=A0ABS3M5A7_9BACT|nr:MULTISPECIES: SDR family NAD(P)-dependent oxidoreductase [Prevotella]MBO1363363.1 SDR family NAD(P)-dependent oxidoreductase [Prevotella illustrans]PTL27388.1 oxidoreductase [Prevotella sp. oral taxon 820]